MAIKLQIRRDTLANWTSNQTVVLLTGEIGYVTDTRNMKIGDGTTQWQYLKYQAPYYTGTNSSLLTTTLSVDQTNNRVGIGTTSPQGPLQVAGSIYYGTSGFPNTIGSDGSNNAVSNASNGHVFQVGASEKVRILSSGNVGIGTNNPASPLHIEGSSPAVRLKDTTAANTAYSLIDGNSDDGSITISADPTAQGAAASTVSLAVDGTTRFQATTTGVAITGTASTSGLLTANGGLTVPTGQALTVAGSGTVSVPSGSITGVAITANTLAPSKITNLAAAGVLGATGAGAVTALTSGLGGTAQTALGLGSAAYTNGSDFICALNQIGQIAFVTFGDSGNGSPAGVYTGVTSTSTTGPDGSSNVTQPTYVSFGGTTTWSKPGSGTRYVRPNQGTWTCIQTNNPVASSTTQLSMICIRTA